MRASSMLIATRSSAHAFDLSVWRLSGQAFTFGDGVFFGPRSYLVIAKVRFSYARAYGTMAGVVGEFNGKECPL